MVDFWDPNNWPLYNAGHEWRIYANARASVWSIVDEDDYLFFNGHLWHALNTKGKSYLARSIGPRHARNLLYLHREIMKRSGVIPPSNYHVLVDHINGNSMDNRKENLRWATVLENNRNVFGSYQTAPEFPIAK